MDHCNSISKNLGEFLKDDKFSDYFLEIHLENDTEQANVFIYKLVNGEKVKTDLYIHQKIFINNEWIDRAKVKICNILCLDEIMNARVKFNELLNRAENCNKNLLEYVGRDKNHNKKFLARCKKCHHITEVYIFRMEDCLNCMIINSRKKNEEFKVDAKIKHGDRFDYDLTEYINNKTKINIRCNKCGIIFLQSPNSHLKGSGCPKCNESKGELRISNYLTKNNISFIDQHTFDDLRHIKLLKLDFYIPSLNSIVEYDGIGHRKATFGSTPEEKQKNLEDTIRNDKIKNQWAKDKGIYLLRISDLNYNKIEEILEAFICNLKKMNHI
jgi:ribosome-binding factor A/phage FluMu protein Com